VTKWWSRQPDPFDVDPTWKGPFDSEADALASLLVPPGDDWGGRVFEEPDDFDPWASVSPSVAADHALPHEWSTAIEALSRVDDFPFLSEDYMHHARVAATAFESAARALAGVDDELAAKAEETVAGLELLLAQPWPDDPSLVETRDFAPDDERERDEATERSAPSSSSKRDGRSREFQIEYPSGITSHVHWAFNDDSFQVTGQDFKPDGGEYEYGAKVKREDLPTLADALGTDVSGIEAAWADQIERISTPGFVTWLKTKGVDFEFFGWHDGDWYHSKVAELPSSPHSFGCGSVRGLLNPRHRPARSPSSDATSVTCYGVGMTSQRADDDRVGFVR
jgi:hypothetical protein